MLVKQSDIRAVLMNKLCGEGSLIGVPEGAEYSEEAAIPVGPINACGQRVDSLCFRKHLYIP